MTSARLWQHVDTDQGNGIVVHISPQGEALVRLIDSSIGIWRMPGEMEAAAALPELEVGDFVPFLSRNGEIIEKTGTGEDALYGVSVDVLLVCGITTQRHHVVSRGRIALG